MIKSYAQQKDPTRTAVGFTFVVILHALLIWALINGLGHKMIELVKGPLVTKIIAAPKTPPKTPPPPPPPVTTTPPPPYIPPPLISVENNAPSNAISAPVSSAPPAPTYTPAPPPVADVDVSDVPLGSSVSLADLYPPSLIDDEVEGSADVECDVDTSGHTSNCKIDSATGSSLFGQAALRYAEGNTYRPATHNGVPVTSHHRWRVKFQLKD